MICSHFYFKTTNIRHSNSKDYVDLICHWYLLDNLEFKDKIVLISKEITLQLVKFIMDAIN